MIKECKIPALMDSSLEIKMAPHFPTQCKGEKYKTDTKTVKFQNTRNIDNSKKGPTTSKEKTWEWQQNSLTTMEAKIQWNNISTELQDGIGDFNTLLHKVDRKSIQIKKTRTIWLTNWYLRNLLLMNKKIYILSQYTWIFTNRP